MKTLKSIGLFSCASLSIMLLVDYLIGDKAEFINAYSVLQRLIGQTPTSPKSIVVQHLGEAGELSMVLLCNVLLGSLLAALIYALKRRGVNKD